MISFFVLFFLIYGGAHLYIFLKALWAFHLGLKTGIPLAFFMLVMVFAPIIIHYSEKLGHESFARLASYVGYVWFGLIFLFFCSSLLVDVYTASMSLGGHFFKPLLRYVPVPRATFLVPLAIAMGISIYGFFEARNIRTESLVIKTDKLPAGMDKLRIAQISDVHIGLIVREKRLGRILSQVKEANPDLLVSTGDLLDGQIDKVSHLAELLQDINPSYGKFAVTGNHEYYAGIEEALRFTEEAGFRVLSETAFVNGPINIVGIDDPTGKPWKHIKDDGEDKLFKGLRREKFTLYLKHRPDLDRATLGLFDLQLSGHTHKGQIFPFSLVTRYYYVKDAGRLDFANGTLYVSRGSGTWGPPIRFLAPPEVTIIDLVRA